jgi:surface protein
LREEHFGRECTSAQNAYLDGVLKGGKMNAPIPAFSGFWASGIFNKLGADLVHEKYGHVEVWDVRECTSLAAVFGGRRLGIKARLDLSFWDTRNVENAYSAFWNTTFDVDVSTWDVSQVRIMKALFRGATGFQGDVSEWDVSNVRDMAEMFSGASMFNGDVSNWDVGLVEDMDMMFLAATSFDQDLSEWKVGNVSSMKQMFSGATLFNSDLARWDVSSVLTMKNMFNGATSFTGGGVKKWISHVDVDVTSMFEDATNVGEAARKWAEKRAKKLPAYGCARGAERRGFV